MVFQANGPNNNEKLFLPRPNPYIPEKLSVNKQEVAAVRRLCSYYFTSSYTGL